MLRIRLAIENIKQINAKAKRFPPSFNPSHSTIIPIGVNRCEQTAPIISSRHINDPFKCVFLSNNNTAVTSSMNPKPYLPLGYSPMESKI